MTSAPRKLVRGSTQGSFSLIARSDLVGSKSGVLRSYSTTYPFSFLRRSPPASLVLGFLTLYHECLASVGLGSRTRRRGSQLAAPSPSLPQHASSGGYKACEGMYNFPISRQQSASTFTSLPFCIRFPYRLHHSSNMLSNTHIHIRYAYPKNI